MTKKVKNSKEKVLFNASVVLAGIRSPNGGSGVLLKKVKEKGIDGKISEVIFDEILRRSYRLKLSKEYTSKVTSQIFNKLLAAPAEELIKKYKKILIDEGDAHVLASAEESKSNILVTLDRKHLLVLKDKVKGFKILTPGELIELLRKK